MLITQKLLMKRMMYFPPVEFKYHYFLDVPIATNCVLYDNVTMRILKPLELNIAYHQCSCITTYLVA